MENTKDIVETVPISMPRKFKRKTSDKMKVESLESYAGGINDGFRSALDKETKQPDVMFSAILKPSIQQEICDFTVKEIDTFFTVFEDIWNEKEKKCSSPKCAMNHSSQRKLIYCLSTFFTSVYSENEETCEHALKILLVLSGEEANVLYILEINLAPVLMGISTAHMCVNGIQCNLLAILSNVIRFTPLTTMKVPINEAHLYILMKIISINIDDHELAVSVVDLMCDIHQITSNIIAHSLKDQQASDDLLVEKIAQCLGVVDCLEKYVLPTLSSISETNHMTDDFKKIFQQFCESCSLPSYASNSTDDGRKNICTDVLQDHLDNGARYNKNLEPADEMHYLESKKEDSVIKKDEDVVEKELRLDSSIPVPTKRLKKKIKPSSKDTEWYQNSLQNEIKSNEMDTHMQHEYDEKPMNSKTSLSITNTSTENIEKKVESHDNNNFLRKFQNSNTSKMKKIRKSLLSLKL